MRARSVAAALAATLLSVAPAAARPRAILIVVKPDNPRVQADRAVQAHLEARGDRVTLGSQYDPVAAGYDLVILSSNIRARDLLGAYRDVPVPVLTWESDLLDDLGMTGRKAGRDFGKDGAEHFVWLVNAPHPLAAGLKAGINTVYVRDAPMNWGKPGLGAAIIATVPGEPEHAVVFGYEAGATMDYESLAPARRTMFLLDNETFGNLTPAGLALFDAAVDWTAGRPPATDWSARRRSGYRCAETSARRGGGQGSKPNPLDHARTCFRLFSDLDYVLRGVTVRPNETACRPPGTRTLLWFW